MPDKKGGLFKDTAVGTWFIAAGLSVCGIIVTVFSDDYCRAYENSSKDSANQNTAYYTAQYTRALGALTAGLCFFYWVWIFVDSRHPAKQGIWTFNSQRLQASRLQAKRQHIQKLALIQVVILIAWIPPSFILAFNGYLYRGRDNAHKAQESSICTDHNTSNCDQLKKAGISTLVMAILIILGVFLTVVPLIVKPKVAPPLPEKEMREKLKKEDEEKAKKDREAENVVRRRVNLPEIQPDGYDPLAHRRGNPIRDACDPPSPPPYRGMAPPMYPPPYGGFPGYGFGAPPAPAPATNIVGFGMPMPSYGAPPPMGYAPPPPGPYGYSPLGAAPPPSPYISPFAGWVPESYNRRSSHHRGRAGYAAHSAPAALRNTSWGGGGVPRRSLYRTPSPAPSGSRSHI